MKKNKLNTLDWNTLWKDARSEKSYHTKKSTDWDKKAYSFAKRNTSSFYVDKFIELLNPQPSWTVLDIGCGPGTIALPLATRVKQITALDFSPKMLEILSQKAASRKLENISPRQLSWTDNWKKEGIKIHDVTIASRALAVEDLRPALEKITEFARKEVIITDKVGHGPFDPEAFAAVGRELITGPDYIYSFNLLHQMGIRASVTFIDLEDTLTCSSIEEAVESYSWMFHDLTAKEKKRLKKYVQSITTSADDGTLSVKRKHIPSWAFMRWKP